MSKLSRAGWASMALLFLGSVVVFTVIAFQQSHTSSQQSQDGNNLPCTQNNKVPNQQTSKDGKVKGAQLADFSPPQKIPNLVCVDYKIGTGNPVQASSTVTVNYVGALASNGKIFDDSFDSGQAATFSLSGVITGWQIGLPGMKVGGIRRLYIPASLAYGDQASGGIPANSDLVFDVQLANIK